MTPAGPLILNVDDNDAARLARTRALTHAGFDVIEAASGEAALCLVHEHLPALALLDVRLPDIDGIEVCRRIKSDPLTASTIVLQISAAAVRASEKAFALECGADSCLTTPIDSSELVANVRALLRLRRAEDQLREADNRKNQFLAILAHELRNPLAPIRNAVELMDPKYRAPKSAIAEARAIVKRQISHLTRLVDDLLDVSRVTHGRFTLKVERVDVATTIAAALEVSRPLVDSRRHTLSVRLPAQTLAVRGDPVRVAQIVTNLLLNAAKYTPSGGRIELDVGISGDCLAICVSDNGVGISEAELPEVFTLFMQSGDQPLQSEGGLGIGLSLVKTLTEMQGGRVSAYSRGLGQGAAFSVELPLYADDPDSSGSTVLYLTSDSQAKRRAGRLLVIDDNEDGALSMSLLIEALGHEVRVALDGVSAVEIAKTFRPEIVILDIGMPGMDGYAVAQALRGHADTSGALLVALTGFGQPEDFIRTREAGFDHHFVKPVLLETLEATIDGYLNQERAASGL